MMTGMDGLEVCRELRGNEVTDHIPIIVVTARITEEERIRGAEAGADAYLAKPFNTDEPAHKGGETPGAQPPSA